MLCQQQGAEYYEETWAKVTRDDLLTESVQRNLIKTMFVFQLSGAYTGVAEAILRSFEGWTKDGSIVFDDFFEEINIWYQRYYCFLGFFAFAFLATKRQLFLLQSRLLLLACVWNVPVYSDIQEYFTRNTFVQGMRADADRFLQALAANETVLGDEKRIRRTISEWLWLFDSFLSPNLATNVDDFFVDNLEVSRLDEEEREILRKIYTLYWGLKGGFIWREVKDADAPGYALKTVKEGKSIDDYYLDILREADDFALEQWLATHDQVARWLYVTGKSARYVWDMLRVLKDKINLNNQSHITPAIALFQELHQFGLEGIDEILYFDEQTNSFQWDENFFIAPPEEEKTAAEVPVKKQDLGLAS